MNLKNAMIKSILYYLTENDETILKEVIEDWYGNSREDGLSDAVIDREFVKTLNKLRKEIEGLKE